MSKTLPFTGSGVAIITPFDGLKTNYDELGKLIEYHIENNTDAIIICGTTGEASTMPDEEHLAAIKYTVEKAAGRITVIAGTGSNDTAHAIELSKKAEEYGVDGILSVTPYYNKTTQKGLIAHFTAIANAIKIPVILYNVPSRTGMSFAIDTLKELAKVENIVAIKEASGNISYMAKVAAEVPDLYIYSGNDDMIVPTLSLGGKGVISVVANILPKETHNICEYYFNGEVDKSRDLQLKMLDLINNLFIEVNPVPIKTAMNLLGFNAGNLRMPLVDMDSANLEKLKKSMTDFGMKLAKRSNGLMTKIIMNGCNGKMGQVITRLVSEDNECEIVAGFDVNDSIENTYPVFTNPDEFTGDADVIIDFSHPSALTTVLNYCKKRKLPVILATTGYTDEQKKEFTEASKEIPVFFSANMSLGINLIIALAKKATKLLEGNFDIEIVERHHNQKIDAPSGTALAIADAIDETLSYPAEYVYDRHAVRRKRKPTEIGIHAVRGGTIVGDHEVIFAGTDEVIELKHSAHSKEVFAVGAIKAAKFMSDKPAGMYSMNDLISTL